MIRDCHKRVDDGCRLLGIFTAVIVKLTESFRNEANVSAGHGHSCTKGSPEEVPLLVAFETLGLTRRQLFEIAALAAGGGSLLSACTSEQIEHIRHRPIRKNIATLAPN